MECCIDGIYVKGDDKFNELIKKFVKKYSGYGFKFVCLWGELCGYDERVDGLLIYYKIKVMLEVEGWMVEIKVFVGCIINYLEWYEMINDLFEEIYLMLFKVRFNEEECKDIIIVLQIIGIIFDFKKDKCLECDCDFFQEYVLYYIDMVDYYLIQKYGWKISDVSIQ